MSWRREEASPERDPGGHPADTLAGLITDVQTALPVPITGAVSDGRGPIRKAARKALKGVPHQLCQFHYLREAAEPISEADRHAKKELKKRARHPSDRAPGGATGGVGPGR